MRRMTRLIFGGTLAALLMVTGGSPLLAQQEGGDQRSEERQPRSTDRERERDRETEEARTDAGERNGTATDAPKEADRRRRAGDSMRGQADRGQADRGQADRGQADRGQADRGQADRGQADRGQADRGRGPAADAQGWVRIATDFDLDGEVDSVEMIYYLDLERARQASRRRRAEARSRPGDRQTADTARSERGRRDLPERQRTAREQRQRHRVSGKLQDLQTIGMAGEEKERLVARIQREDGRLARVLLGPESDVSREQLSDAEQITVAGHAGRVNDRPMLVAELIVVDGETVRVDNRAARRLKRVEGEVLSTRTANFRGYEEPFLIGRVELQGGDRTMVNFGPRGKIQEQLRLREGMPVSLLVRPGRINGQQAWIAEQIHADDRTVELTRPQDRRRFQRSSEVAAEERSRREERAYRGRDQRDEERDTRGDRATERREERRDSRDEERGEERDTQRGEEQPFTYGGEERAALGIFVAEGEQGMEIARVIDGSPADEANLQVGDQLLSIDDTQTDTYRKIVRSLQEHDPREDVRVRIRRDGEARTINVTLKPREDVYEDVQSDN